MSAEKLSPTMLVVLLGFQLLNVDVAKGRLKYVKQTVTLPPLSSPGLLSLNSKQEEWLVTPVESQPVLFHHEKFTLRVMLNVQLVLTLPPPS